MKNKQLLSYRKCRRLKNMHAFHKTNYDIYAFLRKNHAFLKKIVNIIGEDDTILKNGVIAKENERFCKEKA